MRTRTYILHALAALILIPLLMLAGVYGFLQTSSGHRWLAEYLAKEISDPQMQVRIDGLEGHLPFAVEAGRITAADKDGEWLAIDALRLRWGADGIWPLRWRIDYLNADKVHLLRLPAQQDSQPKPPLTLPRLPRLRIRQLTLPDISIESAVAGRSYQFAANITNDAGKASMQLNTLQGPQTSLQLDAQETGKQLAFMLDAQEQAGGLIEALLHLPLEEPLSLNASGEIHENGGTIHAELKQSGAIIAQAEFTGGDTQQATYRLRLPNLSALTEMQGKASAEGVIENMISAPVVHGNAAVELRNAAPIRLDYRLSQQQEQWEIAQFTLRQDTAQADITGSINPLSSTLALKAQLRSGQMEKLVSLAHGAWEAHADIEGPFSALRFTLHGQGELDTKLGLTDHHARLEAEGQLRDWHLLSLQKALLHTKNERLETTTEINTATQKLSAEAMLRLADLSSLSSALQGNAQAKAKIKGSFAALEGDMQVAAEAQGKTITLSTPLRWEDKVLRLSAIQVGNDGMQLTGAINMDTRRSMAEGALQLHASNLASLQPFTTVPLAGAGTMEMKAFALKGKQAASADATFHALRIGDMQAGEFRAALSADDVPALSGLHAQLDAKQVAFGGSMLDSATLRLNGQGAGGRFTLDAKRAGGTPLTLHSEGAYALALPDWSMNIEQLSGSIEKQSYALRSATMLKQEKNTLALRGLRMSLGTGELAAEGSYAPAKVMADISAERLPLTLLSQGAYAGSLRGKASITGTPAAPQLSAQMQAEIAHDAAAKPAHVDGDIAIANNMAAVKLQAQQDAMRMQANARLPVAFSLQPFRMVLKDDVPLQGNVAMNGEVDALSALALPPGQNVRGHTEGEFALSGTLQAPQLAGNMHLRNGIYENAASGTSIQALTADVAAEGNTLTIRNASATDGRNGAITLEGEVTLHKPYSLSLALALHEARLLNSSEASGVIDGMLKAQGTLAAAEVSGALALGPLDIQIPDMRGVDIPQVRIMNPEVLPQDEIAAKPAALQLGESVRLDVRLSAPNRVFIRGRGLETEVRGNLHVTGSLAQPQIDGRLHTERGRYTLLDKDLAITDGQLIFKGPMPPSPFIQMSAETSTKEITAGVQISGPVRAPELTLTSTPPLPQDEILAHLLFGRELRSITPFQAVQLAQAVQNLRGSSGASRFDLLTSARKLLGVDRLTVGGEGKDVSVGAGKYVTDRVYVGVEGGATPDAGKVNAEVELNRRFSIETEAGAHTSGARLNWKYDY